MVYKVDDYYCYVAWPNNTGRNHSFSDVTVVGRMADINVGDIVVSG